MTSPQEKSYIEISLTRGQVALVDASDFPVVADKLWYAHWHPKLHAFYAARGGPVICGQQTKIYMHREILGLQIGDPRQGDHGLHSTLDNRRFVDGRENLRIATRSQQSRNTRIFSSNSSGFKGVSKVSGQEKYRAQIHYNGRQVYLGTRSRPEEAHLLYCEAARTQFGRFCCTK